GLAFRLAEDNYKCICVDLRGHGENTSAYENQLLIDIDELILSIRSGKKVIAIGHSLGGRVALLSHADIKIGISPALETAYSDQTTAIIKSMRQHRVKEIDANINFTYLAALPLVNDRLTPDDLILYCKKDVPEIVANISNLKNNFSNCVEIDRALHNDIFLNEDVITTIKKHLKSVMSTDKNGAL
ncbi:MAG TPA: alpha/beta hydrolase, partial [Spirochaetota bacterium]